MYLCVVCMVDVYDVCLWCAVCVYGVYVCMMYRCDVCVWYLTSRMGSRRVVGVTSRPPLSPRLRPSLTPPGTCLGYPLVK